MGTRAKRLPRAVREQQMLDSAITVLAHNGYHNTSMDAIARQAEISKPMLYLYYGSKEELFAACLERESRRFIEAIAERAAPAEGPRETLEFTLRAVLEFVGEHRGRWEYSAPRQTVLASLQGLGLGVGLGRYLDTPSDPWFWAVGLTYSAVAGLSALGANRARTPD